MSVTLETLEMTPQERELCLEAVRKMAYRKWRDSGQPDSPALDYWLQAQREWIENYYVPHRALDGTPPESKH